VSRTRPRTSAGRPVNRVRWVAVQLLLFCVLGELGIRAVHLAGWGGALLYIHEGDIWKTYEYVYDVRALIATNPFQTKPFGVIHGYVTNSKGLRTPEYRVAKSPGMRRIILLGDSFLVMPGGPDDRDHVSHVLERSLGGADRNEVINLGVTGTGPRFYRRMLEVEGRRLHPDAVIVWFFVGNDLIDEGYSVPPDLATELAIHSYLFRVVRNGSRMLSSKPWRMLLSEPPIPRGPDGRPARSGYFRGCPECWPWPKWPSRAEFERVEIQRSVIYRSPWPSELARQLAGVRQALCRMRDLARADGFGLVVVLLPDETQANASLQQLVRAAAPRIAFDFDLPQSTLTGLCRQEGIRVVDLLPVFRKATAGGTPVFYPQNTHWNPAGQRLAARTVARFLLDAKLLSPLPR